MYIHIELLFGGTHDTCKCSHSHNLNIGMVFLVFPLFICYSGDEKRQKQSNSIRRRSQCSLII